MSRRSLRNKTKKDKMDKVNINPFIIKLRKYCESGKSFYIVYQQNNIEIRKILIK